MAFEHEVAYITAKINVIPPNAPVSTGTGFFCRVPLNDGTDSTVTLLISNKHVFDSPKGRLIVSLNRMKEDDTPDLGNVEKFDQAGFEDGYFSHPKPGVDLACINVSPLTHTKVFLRV